jgi:hypothetical protein
MSIHIRVQHRAAAVRHTGIATLLASSFMAQSGPIEIGLISAKQGVFAGPGTAAANGARIAGEQSGGKLLVQSVQLLRYDDPKDKWDMLGSVRKVPASAADVDALYRTKAEVGRRLGEL